MSPAPPGVRPAWPSTWRYPLAAPPPSAHQGMVVSDAKLASEVGDNVLLAGGNAVDAAVATAFALAVVYPRAGNLGGGGFALVHMSGQEPTALDFRETAPAAATRTMFREKQGAAAERSLVGHLAAGVPGSVAGLWALHRRYGRLPWEDLVAPSVLLARLGFAVDADFANSAAQAAPLFARFPASRALFAGLDHPLRVGDRWQNPDLGATLERIAASGPEDFYRGETARLVVAEMKRGGGLITRADLGAYEPKWRPPVSFGYRGHRVLSMPPPSSGGLVLAFVAGFLTPYDLGASGPASAKTLHLLAEALRRGFALRNKYLADPDFVVIPNDQFVSAEAIAQARTSLDPQRATPSAALASETQRPEGSHTTHLSVVDKWGNAVALTTTLNSHYGAKVVVPDAGFLLNNEMDDFATHPGAPNQFGLMQGEANSVAPGKRMLSSMTPTIVLAPDGSVLLVTGAAGGPRIITAVFQILSHVLDHHMDVTAAVSGPRIHHQHLPDRLEYEAGGWPEAVLAELARMGHTLAPAGPGEFADAPTILRWGGRWTANPEPRNPGSFAAGH